MNKEVRPQIGYYWCTCCIEDLDEIKTQEDLDHAMEWWEDEKYEPIGMTVYPTREAALMMELGEAPEGAPSDLTRQRLGITDEEMRRYGR